MMKFELKEYRCTGQDCRDRALCYRFRSGKGETAPMTSMYVRRELGQNRCDQFVDEQTRGVTTNAIAQGREHSERPAGAEG